MTLRRAASTFAAISAPVSQVGLQSLRQREVTHIVLERDVDCSFVADLPDLTRVDAMVKISNDGPLWAHPGIEHLFLDFATRVPMDAAALPRLATLTVGRRPGWESLSGHPRLQELHAWLGDADDLEWLGSPPRLRDLSLVGTGQVVDLVGLARVPKLEALALASMRVASLEPVGRLTSLTRLALDVTDATGGPMDLSALAALTRLTNVSLAAVASLRPVTTAWLPALLHIQANDVVDSDMSLLDRDWRRVARRELRRGNALPTPVMAASSDHDVPAMDSATFWGLIDGVRISAADEDIDPVAERLRALIGTLPAYARAGLVARFRTEVDALEDDAGLRFAVSRGQPLGDDEWENARAAVVMLGTGGAEQLRVDPSRVGNLPVLGRDELVRAEAILFAMSAADDLPR